MSKNFIDFLNQPAKNINFVKFTFILYFSLMTYTLFSLRNNPATSYEISIYNRAPVIAWVFIGLSIVGGVILIIHQLLTTKKSNYWLIGFMMILLGNLFLTSLGTLRGYFGVLGTDPNVHLGMVTDILKTHHIGDENFYPIMHIFMAKLIILSGASEYLPYRSFAPFTNSIYMMGIVVLAGAIFNERKFILLTSVATAPLILGVFYLYIYPRGLGQFIFPLMFYSYFRSRERVSWGHTFFFVLFIISATFIHPWSGVFLFFFLITIEGSIAILKFINQKKNLSQTPLPFLRNFSFTSPALSIVFFYSWIGQFLAFDMNIVNLGRLLRNQDTSTWIEKATPSIQLGKSDFIIFILKLYGSAIFYAIITILTMMLLLIRYRYHVTKENKGSGLLIFVPWLILSETFWVAFFFLLGGSTLVELSKTVLISPLFVGFLLYLLIEKYERFPYLVIGTILLIIAVPTLLGAKSLYRSPYLYQATPQLTYNDISTSRWIEDYRLPWLLYTGIGFPYIGPYHIYGTESSDFNQWDFFQKIGINIAFYHYNIEIIPSHFGYPKAMTLGEQFFQDKYIILTKRFRDVSFNPILRYRGRALPGPNYGRWDFEEEDFEKLKQDSTMNQIYSSGDEVIYFMRGIKSV